MPTTTVQPHPSAARTILADDIRSASSAALDNPEVEREARLRILGAFLDPAAGVVSGAIAEFERGGAPFPDMERELVSDYVSTAIERRVLGAGSEPLNLGTILHEAQSPFAWGDQFARSCVRHGMTEVRRARHKRVIGDLAEMEQAGAIPAGFELLSAEDAFLAFRDGNVSNAIADELERRTANAPSRFETARARAAALRGITRTPEPQFSSRKHQRYVRELLRRPDAADLVTGSLEAHRQIASGRGVALLGVDEQLLDVWVEHTADHAATLLRRPVKVACAILVGSSSLPHRPKEDHRRMVRRELKALSQVRGWKQAVTRAEEAWAAEFFEARIEGNTHDARTDAEVEAERAMHASFWRTACDILTGFPGAPAGASREDVEAAFSVAYRVATMPQIVSRFGGARRTPAKLAA